MPRPLRVAFLIIVFAFASAQAGEWHVEGADRVVAIADIHGAFDAMVETLQQAALIDENLDWVGGTGHLVIVGDILDRGPKSRDAMDLLMRLEGEAQAAGGAVHVVIGNHESMNLIGDLRYVSKSEYAAFAADETEAERQQWFAAYAERHNDASSQDTLHEEFEQEFPAGFFALRRAFRPDGKYGQWLLSKPVMLVVNGTAFVHGGLSPMVEELGLDGINGRLKSELVTYVDALQTLTDAGVILPTDAHYDTETLLNAYMPALDESPAVLDAIDTARRLTDSELFDAAGPLWYRGSVSCGGLIEEHRLDDALAAIGATRVVVGHTPTPTRSVLQRFDGRLIEIDTGMLNFYYRGSGHALVLQGDDVSVVNQSGEGQTVPALHPRSVGTRPGLMSPEDLQVLLEQGDILSEEKDAAGRTIVRVGDGRREVSAIFVKRAARGFYPGVAAYRLDRLIALDMVPVTVPRKVGSAHGSLQFLADKLSDEGQRSASGRGGGAACALPDQWAAMYVFDVLIYNEGRSLQRMLYDPANWRLMLSEHDRAFVSRKGRPKHLKSAPLEITDGWRDALVELTDEVLGETLGDVLDGRRLRALKSRRDELIASAAATANR
ncbi:MAG: metallophosphoesterase [Woeseiaceae bacterium]